MPTLQKPAIARKSSHDSFTTADEIILDAYLLLLPSPSAGLHFNLETPVIASHVKPQAFAEESLRYRTAHIVRVDTVTWAIFHGIPNSSNCNIITSDISAVRMQSSPNYDKHVYEHQMSNRVIGQRGLYFSLIVSDRKGTLYCPQNSIYKERMTFMLGKRSSWLRNPADKIAQDKIQRCQFDKRLHSKQSTKVLATIITETLRFYNHHK